MEEVLANDKFEETVSRTINYQTRLGVGRERSDFFVNGVPVARDDAWMQQLSMQINNDLQLTQQSIFEGAIEDDTSLPGFLLSDAFDRRNPLVIPQDPKDVRILDIGKISDSHQDVLEGIPRLASDKENALDSVHVIVVGDFDSESGAQLLTAALNFRKEHGEAEVLFLHNPGGHERSVKGSANLYKSLNGGKKVDATQVLVDVQGPSVSDAEVQRISPIWAASQPLVGDLGFAPGTNGIVVNGRAVGPITDESTLTTEDLSQLLIYEDRKSVV